MCCDSCISYSVGHFVMSNDHFYIQVYAAFCLKIMSRDNGAGTDYLMLSHVNIMSTASIDDFSRLFIMKLF